MTGKQVKLCLKIYNALEFHYYITKYTLGLIYVNCQDIL